MATLDDLEATLRTSFDRDTIGVYGDLLQAAGDIRGELIAIDLRLDEAGPDPQVARRRAQLVKKWLGGELPNGRVRYGFVELDATSADPLAQVRFAFTGPAADYVRSVAIVGAPRAVEDAIAVVTAAPRPHLVAVTIRQWSERAVTLEPAAAKAFTAAVPHLQSLELDGRRIFASLAHPTLRRLQIAGWDAIVAGSPQFPALAELDLAFYCHLAARDRPPPGDIARAVLAGMPRLVHLDLSRNEPGYLDPYTLGGTTNAVDFLRTAPIHDRVETVRLPAVDPATIATLRALLPKLTALRRLEIARQPKVQPPVLEHASAEIAFFDR